MRNKSVFMPAQLRVPHGCNKSAQVILRGFCKHPTCQPALHTHLQNKFRQTLKAERIVFAVLETLVWTLDTVKLQSRCSLPASQVTKKFHPLLVPLHQMFYKQLLHWEIFLSDQCWQKEQHCFKLICFRYKQLFVIHFCTSMQKCVQRGAHSQNQLRTQWKQV